MRQSREEPATMYRKSIEIGNCTYEIVKEMWRTKGSRNQTLVTDGDEIPDMMVIEGRRKFLHLRRENVDYWAKQYTGDMGDVTKEYDRTRKYSARSMVAIDGVGVCRGVRAHCLDLTQDLILFEYIPGSSLKELTPEYMSLIRLFVQENGVNYWDLCANNVMLIEGNRPELICIDFEESLDRNIIKELKL